MAAPSTSVLDDFNTGANQLLTGRAGWDANLVRTADVSGITDATPTFDGTSNSGIYFSNVWGTSFAANQEIWVLYNGIETYLYCRLSALGSPSGYECSFVAGAVAIKPVTANVYGTTVVTGSQATSAGDSIGFVCTGSTLEAWYKSGAGSWTLVCTGTDSTWTGGGQIGMTGRPSPGTTTYDSFAGGNVVGGGAPARDTHTAIPFTQGAGGGAFGGAGPH